MDKIKPIILVIEDDAPIRRFLRTSLSTQDYEIQEAEDGAKGLSLAASHPPDVIILDLGLPDMDGLEVLRKIREWCHVPIIILSARGQERDKISGLESGADDYLTKPFGIGELIARIKVALRHASAVQGDSTKTVYEAGEIRIDLDAYEVHRGEHLISLTPLEFKLLALLARHAGKVLTHRHLLKEIWGPGHAEDAHYLRIYIRQLRQKIEEDPNRPRIIITESGVGYRLKPD